MKKFKKLFTIGERFFLKDIKGNYKNILLVGERSEL